MVYKQAGNYQWIKIKKCLKKIKNKSPRQVCKILFEVLGTYLFILFKLVIHIWYIDTLFIHIYWGKSWFFFIIVKYKLFQYIYIYTLISHIYILFNVLRQILLLDILQGSGL